MSTSAVRAPAELEERLRTYVYERREHLRREAGEGWWRSPQTGELLRALFREGTRPSSQDIAARLGYEPLYTRPLAAELGAWE